MTMFPITLGDP